MDVTLGLLSILTKTKSIERVLAPIASQVSLLIILNEKKCNAGQQQGEETPPSLEVMRCAQAVLKATDSLVAVAREQQGKQLTDGVYQQQLQSACEMLDLASASFYIAAQNSQSHKTAATPKKEMEQAAKNLLQAILKLLLVADDAEVRKLVRMVELVEERVLATDSLSSPQSLIPYLKNFTDAVMLLTPQLIRRQRDLIHGPTRESLITSLSVLRKSVPSLNVALQTFVKYHNNPQAQLCRDNLVGQIQSALSDIKQALTSGQAETSFFDTETPGYFIAKIDQILNALSEDQRRALSSEVEVWVLVIVRHSMAVAHLCSESDPHKQLVVDSCQRILQVKTRVVELYQLLQDGSTVAEVQDDFDAACEDLTDECCQLEKHVNMALLHLVVDVFKETFQPLLRLVDAAAKPGEGGESLVMGPSRLMAEFIDHGDKVCQIASLAAASSTHNKRVRTIRASVKQMEMVEPGILPAAVALAKNPSVGASRYLCLLVSEWNNNLSALVKVMDEMTDPNAFMQVTEKRLSWDICLCREAGITHNLPGLSQALQSVLGRARRAAQVTMSIVDNSSDAIYRNGLLVFLRQLEKAIEDVVEAGREMEEAPAGNSVAMDTLTRRLGMLQDAVREVRRGLAPSHHPSILDPRRNNVREHPLPTDPPNKAQPERLRQRRPTEEMEEEDTAVEERLSRTSAVPVASAVRIPSPDKAGCLSLGQQSLAGPLRQSSASASAFFSPEGPGQKSNIRLLHKQFLAAVMTADKVKVNSLTSDILGWTNHIIEVAQALNTHCPELERRSELLELCAEADELAPRLVDKARYVAAGDLEEVDALHTTVQSWADKLDKARVLVDVALDKWKLLTDRVVAAVQRSNRDVLRIELDCITEHQTAMCGLLERVTSLSMCPNLPATEQERVTYLCEKGAELENLTVTLRTVTDLLGHSDEEVLYQVQLEQLCRDWAALMCCLQHNLQFLGASISHLGHQRVAGLREATKEGPEKLHALLTTETEVAGNLLECIVVGDEELQSVCAQLKEDLTELLSELRQLTLLKSGPSVWTSAMYNPSRQHLILAEWILKHLWVQRLVTDQTASFSASLDSLQAAAAAISPQHEGGSGDRAFQAEVKQLSDRMAGLRQRALLGIQLSPDLGKRATVRRCLNDITLLTPKIISAVREMAEGSASESADWNMMQLKQQWAATLQKLFSTLDSMPDLRPSLVPGLKKLVGVTHTQGAGRNAREGTKNPASPKPASESDPDFRPERSAELNTSAHDSSGSFSRSPRHRPIASVLEAATYLERGLESWQKGDNSVVLTALQLSATVRAMTQFCHGQESSLSGREMAQAALTVAECGRKLDQFAHVLADHCLDQGLAKDLLLAANQVSTFSSQLKIVAGVLETSPNNSNADRILLRNATNILQATSRLLEAAETAAVKGLASPQPEAEEGESGVVSLVQSWQMALQSQRKEEMASLPRDDLGLRRVERHQPPQLSSILKGMDSISFASEK